jgi:hypothetical protein
VTCCLGAVNRAVVVRWLEIHAGTFIDSSQQGYDVALAETQQNIFGAMGELLEKTGTMQALG